MLKNAKRQSKRAISLALTPLATEVLARTKAETGVTILVLLERLLEWYAAQDPRIRTMILSPYREVRQGLAKMVLEEMTEHPERSFDPGLSFSGLIDNDYDTVSGSKNKRHR